MPDAAVLPNSTGIFTIPQPKTIIVQLVGDPGESPVIIPLDRFASKEPMEAYKMRATPRTKEKLGKSPPLCLPSTRPSLSLR